MRACVHACVDRHVVQVCAMVLHFVQCLCWLLNAICVGTGFCPMPVLALKEVVYIYIYIYIYKHTYTQQTLKIKNQSISVNGK